MLDFNNTGKLEAEYAVKAIIEGQISTKGRYVDLFEEKMAEYLGTPYVLAMNSGTSALHIALSLRNPWSRAGLRKITIPDLTFVATRNAAIMAGIAQIDVQDVDPVTWCLPLQPYKTISIPVHLYGIRPDHFNDHDIHDAAEAFGNFIANPGGRPENESPLSGKTIVYSFNGNKTMTTSGGGILVCQNAEQYDRAKVMINPSNEPEEITYNYRMTSLAASVGLAQLSRLPELIERKQKIHQIYRNELPDLKFQEGMGIRWMTACLFEKPAVEIQEKLKEQGIPTRRVFKPLMGFPNAERIYEHGLCLPSSTLNSDTETKAVCEVIKRIL